MTEIFSGSQGQDIKDILKAKSQQARAKTINEFARINSSSIDNESEQIDSSFQDLESANLQLSERFNKNDTIEGMIDGHTISIRRDWEYGELTVTGKIDGIKIEEQLAKELWNKYFEFALVLKMEREEGEERRREIERLEEKRLEEERQEEKNQKDIIEKKRAEELAKQFLK